MTEKDFDMLEAGLMKGWSNQRLADVLGVGISTLKRNFGPMLAGRGEASDKLRLAMFATTVRKAVEGGDMGAMRQLRQMMAEDQVAAAEREISARKAADRAKPVGKKEVNEQLSLDAEASLADALAAEVKGNVRH
ncbi:MAG: hypothetical protein IE922_01560 [Sphingomonadales bacterium]|nr:hypothetical protein [Sphingomonadales bacterium]